ncbi:hypothetical protein [Nocardioides pakistanensis]
MSEQPRQPSGTPSGGQFGTVQRPEANVSLVPLDGDYYYPPLLRTPDQIVQFWSVVDLPDEALAACEETYTGSRDKRIEQMPSILWNTHGGWDWYFQNPPVDSDDAAAVADREGRHHAAQVEFEERIRRVLEQGPERLPRIDVRPTVRALAMYNAAFGLEDGAQRVHVWDHTVGTSAGPKTVRQIAEETGLSGLSRHFLDRDYVKKPSVDTEQIRVMLTEMEGRLNAEQRAALEREIEEVRAQLHTVGQIVIQNT